MILPWTSVTCMIFYVQNPSYFLYISDQLFEVRSGSSIVFILLKHCMLLVIEHYCRENTCLWTEYVVPLIIHALCVEGVSYCLHRTVCRLKCFLKTTSMKVYLRIKINPHHDWNIIHRVYIFKILYMPTIIKH